MTLHVARRRKAWTQAQLAARAGGDVTQQEISRLEAGQLRRPRYWLVVDICRALRCVPTDITEFRRPTR